jgi:hypothetical protein
MEYENLDLGNKKQLYIKITIIVVIIFLFIIMIIFLISAILIIIIVLLTKSNTDTCKEVNINGLQSKNNIIFESSVFQKINNYSFNSKILNYSINTFEVSQEQSFDLIRKDGNIRFQDGGYEIFLSKDLSIYTFGDSFLNTGGLYNTASTIQKEIQGNKIIYKSSYLKKILMQ